MNTARLKKLQRKIKKPLLVRNPHHLFYLIGHSLTDGGFLLVTKKGVVLFGGYLEKIFGVKTDSLRNIGKYLKDQKILEIENAINLKELKFLKEFLPRTELIPVTGPIQNMRLIKTSEELAKMKKAYQITTKVFGEVKKSLKFKNNWTEVSLANFIRFEGLKIGADDISFPVIVASGPNAAIPHHVPTSRKLKSRESIVLDFGFKVNGYCSDFARTVFIKSAPEQLAEIYNTAESSYKLAVLAVQTNVKAKLVDQTARNYLEQKGYGEFFIHSLGHGTGIEVHESPSLYIHSPDRLDSGMVFSIEPGIYIEGIGGVRIEDLVYLENNKANYFSKVSTKLSDMII